MPKCTRKSENLEGVRRETINILLGRGETVFFHEEKENLPLDLDFSTYKGDTPKR